MAYRLIIEENTIYEIDEACEACGMQLSAQQTEEKVEERNIRNRDSGISRSEDPKRTQRNRRM